MRLKKISKNVPNLVFRKKINFFEKNFIFIQFVKGGVFAVECVSNEIFLKKLCVFKSIVNFLSTKLIKNSKMEKNSK